jgi:predicted RNA-binding Zn-ribbon protein involved in translation (DUF1610 family)
MYTGVAHWFKEKAFLIFVEAENQEYLEKIKSQLQKDSNLLVSDINIHKLAACGICGWKASQDDSYNWFGCPQCHNKEVNPSVIERGKK